MNSRTRSRSPASIGSNQSSRRWTAASASDCRVGDVVLLLVMAQSPPVCANAGIVWVSAPGDYAILNSNHTPDGTPGLTETRKGTEADVDGVLAAVVDFDGKHDPETRYERLPLFPHAEVETSPASFNAGTSLIARIPSLMQSRC